MPYFCGHTTAIQEPSAHVSAAHAWPSISFSMSPHPIFVNLTQAWAPQAPMDAFASRAALGQVAAAVYAVGVATMCFRKCGPSVAIAASTGAAMCNVRSALPHS